MITCKLSLLSFAFIFLLISANKCVKGTLVDIDQLVSNFTKIVNDLQDNFELEKTRSESTISTLQANFETEKARMEYVISTLQAEIDANKLGVQNNNKVIDDEEKKINEMKNGTHKLSSVVDRLDKMSKLGTSCSQLAQSGNLESGHYLLDTDGINDNQPPYNAYCKMPEEQTFVGKKDIIENIPLFNFSNIVKKYDMKTYTQIEKYLPYIYEQFLSGGYF